MLRLAILGLDPWQHHWFDAVRALRAGGEVELVAVGHASAAAARERADAFKSGATAAGVAAFDDPRRLVQESQPQVILLQRPSNVSLDFLAACAAQQIGLFSLGPVVESLAEAQSLAQVLESRTHLLHIWPHFADSPAARRFAQADEFLRPIRFASACWLGINHALARGTEGAPLAADHAGATEEARVPVRSLSVLAWDLLGTLMPLMGMPTSVYATIRGTVGSGQNFADISGAAAVTLRFPDDAAASLTICDRIPAAGGGQTWNRRDLMLWGKGTLRVMGEAYEFRDDAGKLIDAGTPEDEQQARPAAVEGPLFAAADTLAAARTHAAAPAIAALREFLRQFQMPPSPHRGRPHRLVEIAAVLEALVVSHRTGQPESPERLQQLRR